jgi:hypothetical protein
MVAKQKPNDAGHRQVALFGLSLDGDPHLWVHDQTEATRLLGFGMAHASLLISRLRIAEIRMIYNGLLKVTSGQPLTCEGIRRHSGR